MDIPDSIKENVRAVLLSKTDGSGILVSTFLKDYKSIIHKPLMYKDYGYQTLEKFIKDIPDVCRLEYSDQHMAFKLFGIAKPNTFVSSFVKRAEGNEDSDSSRKSSNKGEKFVPTNDLNEKWEPSPRGLYSLCFPNKKGSGLESKEAVAMKFAQLGEVVEINVIPSLTFIRYRDEKVAKKAIELYGEELKLRRAEERLSKSGGRNNDRKNTGDSGGSRQAGSERNNVTSGGNKWSRKEPDFDDDENWDDDQGAQKPSPGGYRGSSIKSDSHELGHRSDGENRNYNNSREAQSRGGGDANRRNDDRPRGTRGSKQGAGDGHSPRQDDSASRSGQQMSPVEVYIGNWPNEASESDLESLISPYNYVGCRICGAKGSSVKKFAFVDAQDQKEANRIINDLNKRTFRNRDLQCRLGNRKKGDNPQTHDDSHKGGIEKQFEKLAVHKSSPRQNDSTPLLETHSPPYRHNDSMPLLETPSSQYRHNDSIPHLETPSSQYRQNDSMPLLETASSQYRHNDSMPLLETPSSPYSHMPPLESLPNDMPPLEKVLSPAIAAVERHPRHVDMPNLEEISPIKQVNGVADSNAYNPVQLSVGNFPYGTSENELMMLLGQFGAHKVTVMNNDVTSRSTYAFADFGDVSQAVVAMDNLDQTLFKGRKLVVTLTNPAAMLHQQNVSQIPNLMCTVTGNSERTVAIQGKPQMSPASISLNAEKAFERSLKPNRGNFNFQRLTTTLQDYTKIGTKMRAEDHFQSFVGMKMSVMITHVENEKFFWGQILEDSANGVNQGLHRLETLASRLQLEPKTSPIIGLGRCVAKFENEWFRAWCTFGTEKNGQEMGEVIFIDYGNKALINKAEMFKAKHCFWALSPNGFCHLSL
ncbi:uncharacterized protein LOC123566395 [Mercenaria mercenaria]|uniref:uncharacterized protein LOC123566395 n=1 Tax=Mercenaria mercenaria TaxID=6596 RepID=UPI00234ED039|nr:uncharacterized protein LOC123566395 [Mercenaria mercenaria]